MYGFSNNDISITDKQELNRYVSDEQIYQHYIGDFTVNEFITSPRGENTPSFIIDYYDGKLMWRDFGYNVKPDDAVGLVQYIEQLNGNSISYYDAMKKILKDVPAGCSNGNISYKFKVKKNIQTKITNKYKPFEVAYWKSQRLGYDQIQRFNVYPGELWIDKKLVGKSTPDQPLFVYLFDRQNGRFKVYRPYATHPVPKFVEENCRGVVQGWKQLFDDKAFKNKSCVITKSHKDVMSYHALGIPACAPQGESEFLTDEQVVQLKNKYTNIYVNYDPDETGLRTSQMYGEKHHIKRFFFDQFGVKDLTEFRMNYNDNTIRQFLSKFNINSSL